MTDPEYRIPQRAEEESRDHDRDTIDEALRATSAHIDQLLETHGEIRQDELARTDAFAQKEHGAKDDIRAYRTTHPDGAHSYQVLYNETADPVQPDGRKPGYMPYGWKAVSLRWKLDGNQNPVESTYGSIDTYPSDKRGEQVTGTLVVENYGEDRTFGALDGKEALEAVLVIDSTIGTAEAEAQLMLAEIPEEDLPPVERELSPQELEDVAYIRSLRTTKLGHGAVTKN